MTNDEIVKALECCGNQMWSCTDKRCKAKTIGNAIDLINRQKAEIEKLKEEVSKARRKALLEAKGKFAGHSDYHGDTILCKLICMAEGKEVGVAEPLNKSKIKSEAQKEFVERLKKQLQWDVEYENKIVFDYDIDTLLKEMEQENDK